MAMKEEVRCGSRNMSYQVQFTKYDSVTFQQLVFVRFSPRTSSISHFKPGCNNGWQQNCLYHKDTFNLYFPDGNYVLRSKHDGINTWVILGKMKKKKQSLDRLFN